jgi:hypothetical protein
MKLILAVLAASIVTVGCGRVESMWSGLKSYTGTMDRTVVLYTDTGQVLGKWETDNQIEYQGPVAGFIDKKGNTVRISGTFIIEGK